MCEYAGHCNDIVQVRDKIVHHGMRLKAENPKIFKAIQPILEELTTFMNKSVNHMDDLYGIADRLHQRITHEANKELVLEIKKVTSRSEEKVSK